MLQELLTLDSEVYSNGTKLKTLWLTSTGKVLFKFIIKCDKISTKQHAEEIRSSHLLLCSVLTS